MTSDINEIYSRFYLRVEDYNVVGLEENIVKEMMNGWIRSTLSLPYVRRLFDDLVIDEEQGEISYILKFPVSDGEDQDFVEEVIALGMVVNWLYPKVNSSLNVQQYFSNSEQKLSQFILTRLAVFENKQCIPSYIWKNPLKLFG